MSARRLGRGRVVLACVACLGVVMATGAVTPAASAQTGQALLDHGGLPRTYTLYVPPGVERPTGLVVNLHAGGATGQTQESLGHYNAVADAHGFAAVYPDGIDFSWADGRGASQPDRQGVDDVGFLSALIGKLVADLGIDPGRVFATGLSAGAFMANRLACDRADLVAAIAPVAGTLGSTVACDPSQPVSVMQFHGTADPVVPFNGGPMVGRGGASDVLSATALSERWRGSDGCPPPVDDALPTTGDGTLARRSTSSPCAAGSAVVLLSIDGGGHTWPGGSAAPDAGATTNTTDASYASWQFFESHAR